MPKEKHAKKAKSAKKEVNSKNKSVTQADESGLEVVYSPEEVNISSKISSEKLKIEEKASETESQKTELPKIQSQEKLDEILNAAGKNIEKEKKPILVKAVVAICAVIILAFGVFFYTNYFANTEKINVSNSNFDTSNFAESKNDVNQTAPEKNYTSLVQEILETPKYDGLQVSVIGRFESQSDHTYVGAVVDDLGYKIRFKGTNRGFNPDKRYNFTGVVSGSSPKFLLINTNIADFP